MQDDLIGISEKHRVGTVKAETRLSDYVVGKFDRIPSKKGMKKAIAKGWVLLNGKRAYSGDYLKSGDLIELQLVEKLSSSTLTLDLQVLYEDEFMAAITKPAGIEVSGNKKWTLENALPNSIKPSTLPDKLLAPQAIHRLDYPTTGILLVGKTRSAVRQLNAAFEKRQIEKVYVAVCIGKMPNSGDIELSLDEKKCHSSFEVLTSISSPRFDFLNLVKLTPHTGRKHQLRRHMHAIGHPVLGDKDYALEGKILRGKGLYLHACKLEFEHPAIAQSIRITANLPQKFKKLFPDFRMKPGGSDF